MSLSYFGTDGIRGAFGSSCMNEAFAYCLGQASLQLLKQKGQLNSSCIVVGRDTRTSGNVLFNALACGIIQAGGYVLDLGIVPTAAVSLYTDKHSECDLGIMISASHNPATDNGFKFFNARGHKLNREDEKIFEEILHQIINVFSGCNSLGENSYSHIQKIKGDEYFVQYVQKMYLEEGLSLNGLTVVLDSGNGSTYQTSLAVLKGLGAEVSVLGHEPNGMNINVECGSEHPEKLQELVRKVKADVGIAHDGDGDRLVVVDEKGNLIDGDELLGVLALGLKKKNKLMGDQLVVTLQSNTGLDASLSQEGIQVERVDIGDRNVFYRMVEVGSSLGGESSGHIILSDYLPTGDGLIAACQLCSILRDSNQPLSVLRQSIQLFPQATAVLKVREKEPLENLKYLQQKIQEIELRLQGEGRLLVRYSGTELKLRFLVEAAKPEVAAEFLQELINAASQDLEMMT